MLGSRAKITMSSSSTPRLFRTPHPVLNTPGYDDGLKYTLEGNQVRTFQGLQSESVTFWTREVNIQLSMKKLARGPNNESGNAKTTRVSQMHQYIMDLLEGEAHDWYIEQAGADADFMTWTGLISKTRSKTNSEAETRLRRNTILSIGNHKQRTKASTNTTRENETLQGSLELPRKR